MGPYIGQEEGLPRPGARRPPACRRPCRVCCASRRPRGGPVPGGQSPLRPVRTTHASGRAKNIIEWGLRWLRGARARVRRAHRGGGQAARLARPHVLATRSHVVGGHTCDQREVCKHNLGPEIKFGVAASDRKRPEEGGAEASKNFFSRPQKIGSDLMPNVERASPGSRRTKFHCLASLQCGVITLARSDRQHRESRCPAATGRLEEKHQMGRRAVGVRRPERTCP